jgi:hypothetical protein
MDPIRIKRLRASLVASALLTLPAAAFAQHPGILISQKFTDDEKVVGAGDLNVPAGTSTEREGTSGDDLRVGTRQMSGAVANLPRGAHGNDGGSRWEEGGAGGGGSAEKF